MKHGYLLDTKAQTRFNTDGSDLARPSMSIEFVQYNFSFNLAKWVVGTVSPFSIVEQKSFISLIHDISPLLIVSNRNTVRKRILARQSVLCEQLYSIIHSTATSVSLTCDARSNRVHRVYVYIAINWVAYEWKLKNTLLTLYGLNFSYR